MRAVWQVFEVWRLCGLLGLSKVAEMLRFHTFESGGEQINSKEFADRLKDGQCDIFTSQARVVQRFLFLVPRESPDGWPQGPVHD
mmetsp:Transcript_40975/g.127444  ORF Transcript_40975/g.127444 Transcript_40975/m.127444 type:complete len:85 (+) Transcript_40975:156-410(+)